LNYKIILQNKKFFTSFPYQKKYYLLLLSHNVRRTNSRRDKSQNFATFFESSKKMICKSTVYKRVMFQSRGRPICDALGIDDKAQKYRIKRDEILSSTEVIITSVGTDGNGSKTFIGQPK
jgi:hypothetical protein